VGANEVNGYGEGAHRVRRQNCERRNASVAGSCVSDMVEKEQEVSPA
jgi:hypothetical protein